MRRLLGKILFFTTMVGLVSSCSKSNTGPDDQESSNKKEWSEEERRYFTQDGTNSIGVPTEDYNYAIVVGNPGMNLIDEKADVNEENMSAEKKPEELGYEKEKKSENAEVAENEESDEGEDEMEKAEESEDAEVEEATEKELAQCSEHFGKTVTGIQISGKESHTDVEPSDLIAVKMSGNRASINLLLTAEEGAEGVPAIEGICLIVSGNKPTANVVINGVTVGKMYYLASGNDSSANVEVKEGASITDLAATLNGNAGQLQITGAGTYNCDAVEVKGSALEPVCGSQESSD